MIKFKRVTETGPEPISLSEAKSWLRVETADEEDMIRSLLLAARSTVETYSKSPLLMRSYLGTIDAWPEPRTVTIALQPFPLLSALRVYMGGSFVTLPLSAYVFTTYEGSGCLYVESTAPAPQLNSGGIELELTVDPTLRPHYYEPMKMAMRLLVTRWFANRGDQIDMSVIPADVRALLAPVMRRRLA